MVWVDRRWINRGVVAGLMPLAQWSLAQVNPAPVLGSEVAPSFSFQKPTTANTGEQNDAQNGAPKDAHNAQLPAVVVKGRAQNGIGSSDAASQGVISAAQLENLATLRPGDALQSIPGLVVTQHSGDGKANQYFLRGYNLDHGTDFATFVDGVQANKPTHAHGQGYADVNYLIPELIERIDYRKGPYDAASGDFTSAGSAHVVYKKALDANVFDVTLGAFGYQRVLMAGSTTLMPTKLSILSNSAATASASSGVSDAPTLLGALELQHQNGPWLVAEKLQKVNGLLKFSQGTLSSGWSVDAAYYGSHWNATDPIPLNAVQAGQLPLYGSMNASDGGKNTRSVLSGERHETSDEGYQKFSVFLEHDTFSLWSDFTFFELRPTTGDQFEQQEGRNAVGAHWTKGWNHDLYGWSSSSEVGLQARYDNIQLGLFNTQARRVLAMVSQGQVGEWSTAVYAQNTTSWTPWARTVIGARLDRVDMSMSAAENAANSGLASATQASPKLAVILGPWHQTEVFLSVGRGFHSNDARGVIDKIDPTTLTASPAIPALVSSMGSEVGVRSQVLERLQSSLALWQLKSNSELVYNADSNLGSTSANGASVRSGVEWTNHYEIPGQLLLDADWAWTKARYSNMNDNGEVGNHIPNAVGKVGLFRVTLQHLGPWSMGWETRYMGAYPLTQDGSQVAPSAVVSNFRLKRRMNPSTQLSMDVLNVFNRQYFDVAYSQDYQLSRTASPEPQGITFHPGEPRQLRLGVSISF